MSGDGEALLAPKQPHSSRTARTPHKTISILKATHIAKTKRTTRYPVIHDTHGWISVRDEVTQGVDEALVAHKLWGDVEQLGHANRRCFLDVRILPTGHRHDNTCFEQFSRNNGHLISQGALQRVTQVLRDLVDADAAHRAHSQRADQGTAVRGVLLHCNSASS